MFVGVCWSLGNYTYGDDGDDAADDDDDDVEDVCNRARIIIHPKNKTSRKRDLPRFLWIIGPHLLPLQLVLEMPMVAARFRHQWAIVRVPIDNLQGRRFPPNPTFAHTQITHPNNIIYLSPKDE